MKETRNSKVLRSFVEYCEANPTMRFWQSLRNWAKIPFLIAGKNRIQNIIGWDWKTFQSELDNGAVFGGEDTFYWEEKNKGVE